jgi:hypothetical protein
LVKTFLSILLSISKLHFHAISKPVHFIASTQQQQQDKQYEY